MSTVAVDLLKQRAEVFAGSPVVDAMQTPFANLADLFCARRCDVAGKHRRQSVGSHLGLRILNFAPKKPSNVRISTENILTFDGFASPLELQTRLSRIGIRTLFAPKDRLVPTALRAAGLLIVCKTPAKGAGRKSSPLIVAPRIQEKVGIPNSQINWLRQVILSN